MKKDEHIFIKIFLIIYACSLFAMANLIPIFVSGLNEEGRFEMWFLQDTSFAWVSGIFVYFFGKVFIDLLKRKPSSMPVDSEDK